MDSQTNSHTQLASLPDSFRPLFWSYRFEELDPSKDKKTVVIQLMNYGSLTHWRWLIGQYGRAEIRNILQSIPATEIKPRTRELASILFSIPAWNHALRGAH